MISISSTLSQKPRYTNFDATNTIIPNPHLAYLAYNCHINLGPTNSGAAKVQNPNALETLLRNDLDVGADGYLHAYVSNGSDATVNFDNFLVQYQRGKLRQINDYYPYGLTIAGLNSNSDEYLNKYTTKELQTGEFDASLSTGLEMFDFGSRFGACPEQMVWRISACRRDPQLGVWFTPDPAEQFHNPYLAMGNNPVMYVDPDGEFVFTAAALIAAPFTGGASLSLLPYTIGADLGAWQGGTIANGTANPFQWDYSSGSTWSHMAGGALVEAASGGAANTVATSGMAFANTAAIMTGSFISNVGMRMVSGGQTDVSISLGAASYTLGQNEWGILR